MSRGVNVLAILERAAYHATLIPDLSKDLKQARAAVAELIEAVDFLAKLVNEASTEGRFADGIGDELDSLESVQAALARVRGAA
ncbi:hypothetical protein [Stenotrophomonas cyclobalanopsidis]|uniref:hypothetical protein n=1 Tax=Stenotrophomonas cyclobalanopsidis TaxID=2771362 RepID=UPI002FDABFC8